MYNAAVRDDAYFQKRISVNEAFLDFFFEIDDNLYENARRAIAESYYELGNREKADLLFERWLEEDPAWGWGWIGWSDCYYLGYRKEKNYQRAEEILLRGLKVSNVRDKEFLFERLEGIYNDTGEEEKLIEIKNQIRDHEKNSILQSGVSQTKVGRNDPCPCGSGKKYKKCCLIKE
ncbi:MAG: hypothetical protein A2W19_14010 [Spirochaetes bacterium RBG_16_49_21]|nr:MAG: hypothetical protein A2W19_14010 [Spirochaetes bacterium RBG_16_49_21]